MKVDHKHNEGNVHSIKSIADDQKLLYHSPGAHNQLENPGKEQIKCFNLKLDSGSVRGRLDQIAGDPEKHIDRDAITFGSDIDTRRAHVFEIQYYAVEEW